MKNIKSFQKDFTVLLLPMVCLKFVKINGQYIGILTFPAC